MLLLLLLFAAGGEDADIGVVMNDSNDAWVMCRHIYQLSMPPLLLLLAATAVADTAAVCFRGEDADTEVVVKGSNDAWVVCRHTINSLSALLLLLLLLYPAGGEDADIEVVVKGSNDTWVVCRHTGSGRQLTAVVENEKEGLAGVMRKVQGFCDTQCPGVFEGLS